MIMSEENSKQNKDTLKVKKTPQKKTFYTPSVEELCKNSKQFTMLIEIQLVPLTIKIYRKRRKFVCG